jgi:hypothetical protein
LLLLRRSTQMRVWPFFFGTRTRLDTQGEESTGHRGVIDKCRSLGLSDAAQHSIKADIFGPALSADRPAILDAESEETFDERLNRYSIEWSAQCWNR